MKHFFLFFSFITCSCFVSSQTFLPSDISGLTLWLSADSVNIVNGKIETWYDRSGNNNSAIQTDSLKQPVLISNDPEINNQPVVKFDGVDDYLQFTDINNIKTSFFVFNHSPVQRVNDNLIGHTTNANGSLLSGGLYKLIYYSPNWLNIAFLNGVSFSPYALTQDSLYSIVTLMPSPDGVANTVSHNKYQGYEPWRGNIAEILFYDKVLSNAERISVQQYLNNKYSPPVNLGPDFSIPYGFCDTLIDAGSRFNSFLWSTGDTTQTTAAGRSGNYWVTVTDMFGLQSTDTVNITFPGKTFQADTTICSGSSFQWNTNLSHNGYGFQWQDFSSDSVLTISSGGQYYVQIADTTGCTTRSDTLLVSIDNFNTIVSLGNDTSFCSGNYIYLQLGASLVGSYLWSDGSSNDSLQVFSSGQYWVTLSGTAGCTKTDSINILISGSAPVPDFSSSALTCVASSIQFTDLSVPPSGDTVISWSWNFGDSSLSSLQNPVHIFADTGNYFVTLYVTTNEGCSAAITKQIHINPFPSANFTASNLCEDERTSFSGTAVTYGYAITQWSWNFADPASGTANSSLLQNPAHSYSLNGVYPVVLLVTNTAGCTDTVINNIAIKQGPVANFNTTLPCQNEPVQFTDNSILPPLTTINITLWNFGDGFNSSLLNPSHLYSSAATYNVMHIIAASNGCRDTAIYPVTVHPKPLAAFSAADQCSGTPASFSDNSVISGGSISGWSWLFNATVNSTLQNPQHLFTVPGTYNVQLIVNSALGCKDTVNQPVTIHPLPVAGFTFSPQYGSPPLAVNFNNTSTGALVYQWDFDDGALSLLDSPDHVFADTGSYQVSLIASNAFGCSDTIDYPIEVKPRKIDVQVSDFTTVIQNNFLTVTAEFKNNGTFDVQIMEVYFKVNNGEWIKEEWGGSLLRNGTSVYTFSSSVFIENEDHYVCVSAQKPNGFEDDVPSNNELCNTIDIDRFQVFPSYPNPVDDIITLPLFVPGLNDLSVIIYNGAGKKVEEVFSGAGEEGFYELQINTLKLGSGIYVFRIVYQDEMIIQKFIKK